MPSRRLSSAPRHSGTHSSPRQMRERRTAAVMIAFGLLLGGLELFIVLHYV